MTIVREHALDVTGRKDVRVSGLDLVHTLGEAVVGADKADLTDVTADGRPFN